MTPTLMKLIAEWRAAHPKAWPYGLDTAIYGFTMHGAEFELRFALALIESAVMDEIGREWHAKEDREHDKIRLYFDAKVDRWCASTAIAVWYDAPTRLHALLLAERAMRGAT